MVSDQVPFILLDESSDIPVYQQIYEAIRKAILGGTLRPGARLPATRLMAKQLGVARMTILNAYEKLFAEGYLEAKLGAGTYVAAHLPEEFFHTAEAKRQKGTEIPVPRKLNFSDFGKYIDTRRAGVASRYQQSVLLPFRHGIPALEEFPFDVWTKLLQRLVRSGLSQPDFAYGNPAGFMPLRSAIASHLSLTRGINCRAEQIIVTSGTQQSLDLIARIFVSKSDEVCVEDPCYFGIRYVFSALGAKIVPVPIDGEGFDLENATSASRNPKLIYTTPSHQYPLGITMSLARRLNLLKWASQKNAFVIEDDYDSEYRYAGRPLAALQGLDRNGRVIYIGTFSKTVFPGLRLGFMVAPDDLVDILTTAKALSDWHSPILDQAALAEFISEGHYSGHLRKMRGIYEARQRTLVKECDIHLRGLLKVAPAASGMHLVGLLPGGVDDKPIAIEAARHSLLLAPISGSSINAGQKGFFLGYTCYTEGQIIKAVKKLRNILAKFAG